LLIIGSAPASAVAASVFVATVAVRGGSAAPAALLPPLMLQCRQTSAAACSVLQEQTGHNQGQAVPQEILPVTWN
jgi:hypothetical protein